MPIIVLGTFLVICQLIYRLVVLGIFPEGSSRVLTICFNSSFLVGVIALISMISCYISKQNKIIKKLYMEFSRSLGCDNVSLQKMGKKIYDIRQGLGIWHECIIRHKESEFSFALVNAPSSNKVGHLPFFVISPKGSSFSPVLEADLDADSKNKLLDIKKRIGKDIELFLVEGRPSFKLPVKSNITIEDLHALMDMLKRGQFQFPEP